MEQNICPICGSPYVFDEKTQRFSCRFCGYIKPREVLPEEGALLFSAAQRLRLADFDGAQEAYEDIASRFPDSPEAHWGLALCEYGIKYEDDYDGKKIPTCYSTRYESLFESAHFKKAVSLADKELKDYYESQAKLIERVREEWVEKAKKEPPYDIFLSFKDTDDGKRTEDSYDAYEIYNNLTRAGYRVFFSRVTLAGKSGENYEPYIFAALNSAPCMLLFASKPEYVTSTWVKNEWMRYLARIRQKKKSADSLCVIFKDFNPSSLPAVLRGKQNLKYGELTFLEDLKAYCDKIVSAAKAITPKIERKEVALAKKQTQKALRGMEAVEATSALTKKATSEIKVDLTRRELGAYQVKKLTASQESILFQAEIYLSKGDFDKAQELYHQVLDEDSKNPSALMGELLATSRVTTLEDWVKKRLPNQTDLEPVLSLIDYSPKETSTVILDGYSSLIVSKAKAKEYKAADSVYSAICDYDLECVNALHKKLFNIVSENVSDSPALSLAEKALVHLSSDKEAYRLGLETLISNCIRARNYSKAENFSKTYSDYFDLSAEGYLLSLQAKTRSPNQEALFQKIADEEKYPLLSKDLPLGEEEIDELFGIVAKFTLEHIQPNPNLALSYINFLLPFRFLDRQDFIDAGIQKCLEMESLGNEKIFDALLSTFGNENIDQYVQYQLDYVSKKVASLKLASAYDILLKKLQSLLDYAPNSTRLHHLRICLLCHSPEKEQPDHFCSLKDFGPLESILSLRGKKKVDEVLSPYFDAFYKSITNDETSLSDHQDTFDALCSYYPKEENQELYTRFTYQATQARERGEFDVAVKYYSLVVQEYPNDHRFHWRLLQVKLGCKTNDELIHQMVPIGELPDYANAKIAAGTDRDTVAHYIDIEMRQAQWIRAEEEKRAAEEAKRAEENEKARLRKIRQRKRRIFFLSALGVVTVAVTLSILAATVFVPSGRVINARKSINSGNYDSAIAELSNQTYGESENLLNMAYAGKSFNKKDYEEGIDYVIKAGGEVQVNYDGGGRLIGKSSETIGPKRAYINNDLTETGYKLTGWIQTDFDITISNTDYVAQLWLKASSEAIVYTINYDLAGGTNNFANPASYCVTDEVSLLDPSREGYTFLGWFDSRGNRVESIPLGSTGDLLLSAKWNGGNEYSLVFDAAGGSVSSNSLVVVFDQPYELPAPEKPGYKFLGWYDGLTEIALTGNWKFPENKSLTAHWTAIHYSISYSLGGGINNERNPISYTIEDQVVFSDPTRVGYAFLGWFDSQGNRVESIPLGSTGDLLLSASWNRLAVTSLSLNTASVQKAYLINLATPSDLDEISTTGLIPTAHYSDGTIEQLELSAVIIDKPILNSKGEKTVTVSYEGAETSYVVKVGEYTVTEANITNAENKAVVTVCGDFDGITAEEFASFPWTADFQKNGYNNGKMNGSFEECANGPVVLNVEDGSFRYVRDVADLGAGLYIGHFGHRKAHNASDYAHQNMNLKIAASEEVSDEIIIGKKKYKIDYNCGQDDPTKCWGCLSLTVIEGFVTSPRFSSNGKTVTYGLYPQKRVTDKSLISVLNATTPESNGWYLFGNKYYAKAIGKPATPDLIRFDDGITVQKDETYWFCCDPIEWSILSNLDGGVLAVSSLVLDAIAYDGDLVPFNSYEFSTICTWLNNDFLFSAFSLDDSAIQETSVDGLVDQKAFLLNESDYQNSSYGFSSDYSRRCKATDWAKANGVWAINSDFISDYSYKPSDYCDYWIRFPGSSAYTDRAPVVAESGRIIPINSNVGSKEGVRPALIIKTN